jgi:hypothetical protein
MRSVQHFVDTDSSFEGVELGKNPAFTGSNSSSDDEEAEVQNTDRFQHVVETGCASAFLAYRGNDECGNDSDDECGNDSDDEFEDGEGWGDATTAEIQAQMEAELEHTTLRESFEEGTENMLKNFERSRALQGGAVGPAANLLRHLGVAFPDGL